MSKGTIIIGLAVFLAAVAFPVWYGFIAGDKGAPPDIEKPAGETHCVADNMTARHMDLLNKWRDAVVRDGERFHTYKGQKYEMSLTRTCLKCHVREQSCDRCHNYVDVNPYCWDCHLGGKEK